MKKLILFLMFFTALFTVSKANTVRVVKTDIKVTISSPDADFSETVMVADMERVEIGITEELCSNTFVLSETVIHNRVFVCDIFRTNIYGHKNYNQNFKIRGNIPNRKYKRIRRCIRNDT